VRSKRSGSGIKTQNKIQDPCNQLTLQEIIVEVYEDGPSDHIQKEIKNHGWTISATKYVEESDYIEDDDDYHYDHDSGGDDYDIDNDSDFWRRAGD
jgi:hypothetical protein